MTAVLLAEPPDDPYAELRKDAAELHAAVSRVIEAARLEQLLAP